ncbi:MAG: succinate dehydrogenase iron-sulfur subunit [Conexivisphaerales archaeon]
MTAQQLTEQKAASKEIREFTIAVKRSSASSNEFEVQEFRVKADRFTTVLDALLTIKAWQDNTLSIRYSCRMGICGSCAMVINNKPRLACETNIFSLGSERIEVGPMEAHPILKDLVTDFEEFFRKHRSVKPWLIRDDVEEKFRAEKEYTQTRRQLDYYLPFSYCIKCGLCVDACPISNTNPLYLGPQALAQAYRYNNDSRDQGEKERLEIVDDMNGVWGCEFAGACSLVCPKGVDPALAIQLLKLDVMKYRITGKLNVKKEF